jgi:hypothetical protein
MDCEEQKQPNIAVHFLLFRFPFKKTVDEYYTGGWFRTHDFSRLLDHAGHLQKSAIWSLSESSTFLIV